MDITEGMDSGHIPEVVSMYITQQASKDNLQLSWKILDNISSKTVILTWRDCTCVDSFKQNPSAMTQKYRPKRKSFKQRERDTKRMALYQERLSHDNPVDLMKLSNNVQTSVTSKPLNSCSQNDASSSENNVDPAPKDNTLTNQSYQMCDDAIHDALQSTLCDIDSNVSDVTNVTPTTSARRMTRSTSKSQAESSPGLRSLSDSQCQTQVFEFRRGTGRRELKNARIVSADSSTGKLVLDFCYKCHHNWKDLFVNMRQICGITLKNKELDSFSWRCATCHKDWLKTDNSFILDLLKS